MVLAIDCLGALLAGSVMVWKARSATQIEIASAMQLARTLVADTIRLMQDSPAPLLLQSLDLHFQSVRHVRLNVVDANGEPVEADVSPAPASGPTQDAAPDWFLALVALPIERTDFPIVVRGRRIGTVMISSVPNDEIGEAWTYAHALLMTAVVLNAIVLAALYLAFGRIILAPLNLLAAGLKNLESKTYKVRLATPSVPELALIATHFNKAAEALSAAQEANTRLNLQLLTAQDDERRRTALELHDEAGPCLFALDASASSIVRLSASLPGQDRLHERAEDVLGLVQRLKSINRRLLDRLRPMALGRIPLRESLFKLLVDLDIAEGGPLVDHHIDLSQWSFGPTLDLTIYRCVQEGLFNAIRHAAATQIRLDVRVDESTSADEIIIRIADDGKGIAPDAAPGMGLAGMRERVEAQAGRLELARAEKGTILTVTLPIMRRDEELGIVPDHPRTANLAELGT